MPLKTLKTDAATKLTLEWILHVQRIKLTLEKTRCVGCQICTLVCPKSAVTTTKQPRGTDGKARKVSIDVDLAKCNFCGLCDLICPYGAIKVTTNGKHQLSVVEKESFPELIRDIHVDTGKMSFEQVEHKKLCPLDLIHVTAQTSEGTTIENVECLTRDGRDELTVKIDIEKEHCPCCGVCEVKLPGIMHVRKILNGKITVHQDNCPAGCKDCLDVCPITETLYVSDQDGKVHVNELYCTYCGACKLACPIEEALELKRTHVCHTPVHSGAWNKALERLTSTIEMSKELKTKGSFKTREAVKKAFRLEENA